MHIYLEAAAEAKDAIENCKESRLAGLRGRAARIAALRIVQIFYKSVELNKVGKLASRITLDISLAITALLTSSWGNAVKYLSRTILDVGEDGPSEVSHIVLSSTYQNNKRLAQ